MVYPSGLAAATAATPRLIEAPGLFTGAMGCPRYFSASFIMIRTPSLKPSGGTG